MSYSSSSVQPTVQAFETLVENELRIRKFVPYTSTSTLNLDDAVNQLTSSLLTMSAQSSDVTGWAAGCKPPAGGDPNLCAAQSSSLAAAQQVINGYTALLQSSNDGAGNAVILDILRGAVLVNTAGGHHLPSIQLTIPAAGGSTRVNAFFLVNLFYLPKPSYNAGVIALFEIRDGNNLLEYSGARTVFYDYNKTWLGAKFTPDTIKAGCSASDDDTTCIMTRD
jgi:hypothetical protein